MLYSNELDTVVKENFSSTEIERLEAAMEAPTMALDIMKNMFDAVLGSFNKFIKSLNDKSKLDKGIELSKGDISKVTGIETTLKVLEVLKKDKDGKVKKNAENIYSLYKEILALKVNYIKSFSCRNTISGQCVWATYVCEVYLVISATSYLLMVQSGQRKLESTNLFKRTEKLIEFHRRGKMKTWCEFFLQGKKAVQEEAALVITVALLGTIITVAFFIRVLVFYFYYLRMELSDYFGQQAAYLNIHASELKKSNSLDPNYKHSVINAQKSWADRFTSLSDFIASDDIKAERKVSDNVKHSNKEVNPSKISIPSTEIDFL